MKKMCLLFALIPLLLTGCGGKAVAKAPDALAKEVLDALPNETFTACDEDYVTNSFDFAETPDAYALYLGEEFGVEFGVFAFRDNATARLEAKKIDEYLAREEQAVRDLAAMYPAAELSARLDRYARASVRIKGNTVAYFLLSETARTAAEAAFIRAAR